MARRKKKTPLEKFLSRPGVKTGLLWGFVSLLVVAFVWALYSQIKVESAKPIEDDMSKTLSAMEEVMKAEKISATATDPYSVGFRYTQSADPSIRIKGINMIVAADPVRATRVIHLLLNDPDASVQMSAVRACQTFKLAGSGAQIVRLLSSDNPSLRNAAAGALSAFRTESGILDRLQQPLGDRDPEVVKTAINVWGTFAHQDRRTAFRIIRRPLSSRDESVANAALAAVKRHSPDAREQQMMGIDLTRQ